MNKEIINIDAPIANILKSPRTDWRKLAGNSVTARSLSVDWAKFNERDYLFTHCTIMASVNVEKNGYYITPATAHIVNANGNSWSSEVLLATFRSFIGGQNYLEHIQRPELSKGTILDAIIRPVEVNGETVQYVDLLVATERKHKDLVEQIESGEYNAMSMGCWANKMTCSKCGEVFNPDADVCSHLNYEIGTTFIDENGVERIVSEMCGETKIDRNGKLYAEEDCVEFFEASWVGNPAFKGAVLNHYISDVDPNKQHAVKSFDFQAEDMGDLLFGLKVANSKQAKVLKMAQNLYKMEKKKEVIFSMRDHTY